MGKEKKNKSKKVVIIVSVILGILVLIFLILPFMIRLTGLPIGNMIYEMQMKNVDKDITIQLHDRTINFGGYAESYDYFYIDIDKKKIYEVYDYYVFGVTSKPGEGGHHYTIQSIEKLTNEQINETIDFITKQISNKDPNVDLDKEYYENLLEKYEGIDKLEKMMFLYGYDYVITYKDETIVVDPINASIINEITGNDII